MSPNKHIGNFLNYYLNDLEHPDYAVMISGCWGSGKTYFIKRFLFSDSEGKEVESVSVNDWLTGCKMYSVVYVSLFGAKNREEIDSRVANIFHNVLNSKKLKIIKGITSIGSSIVADIYGFGLRRHIRNVFVILIFELFKHLNAIHFRH